MKSIPCSVIRTERPSAESGASLLYFILVLVVLGVMLSGMISMFQTSMNITTVTNHPKRAYYMAESGVRYLESQLINATGSLDQKTGLINNIPKFNVENDLFFEAKVFRLGALQAINNVGVPANQTFALKNRDNSPFSSKFTIPIFGQNEDAVYLVNSQELDKVNALEYADIKAVSFSADLKTLYATVGKKVDPPDPPYGSADDEKNALTYYLAIQQHSQMTLSQGCSIDAGAGAEIFPRRNGIISLNTQKGQVCDYKYTERKNNGTGYTFTNLQRSTDANGNAVAWNDPVDMCPGGSIQVKSNTWIILNSDKNTNMWGDVTGYSGTGAIQVAQNLTPNFFVREQSRAPKANITFGDEHNIVESDPGKNPIVMLAENKGISLGAGELYAFGAIWFKGTKKGVNLNCVDGECEFGQGVRVFYSTQFLTQEADGFVFGLINGDQNTYNSIGGDSSMGELLAWAGDSRVYAGENGKWHANVLKWVDATRNGIVAPKFGVEFDTYVNSGNTCVCWRMNDNVYSSRLDKASSKHIGYVFWGNDLESGCANGFSCKDQTSASGASPTAVGLVTYDDNKHSTGENTATDSVFVATDSTQKWWETSDASKLFGVRIEMHRNLVAETSGAYTDKYKYTLKTWVHSCTGPNCSEYICQAVSTPNCPVVGKPKLSSLADLDKDFNVTTSGNTYLPVITKELYLTAAQHQQMETVLIGFTEGTGAKTQIANITNYEVKFRSGGDEAPITTLAP